MAVTCSYVVSGPEGTQAAVNVWPALFRRDESLVKHLAEEGEFCSL